MLCSLFNLLACCVVHSVYKLPSCHCEPTIIMLGGSSELSHTNAMQSNCKTSHTLCTPKARLHFQWYKPRFQVHQNWDRGPRWSCVFAMFHCLYTYILLSIRQALLTRWLYVTLRWMQGRPSRAPTVAYWHVYCTWLVWPNQTAVLYLPYGHCELRSASEMQLRRL